MFDIITEPDWDIDWLDVQFDPDGNACAMQDRYALKAQEQQVSWIIDCLEALDEEFTPGSAEYQQKHSELQSELTRCEEGWDYLSPVVLGPYTREALVGRDDYREF